MCLKCGNVRQIPRHALGRLSVSPFATGSGGIIYMTSRDFAVTGNGFDI